MTGDSRTVIRRAEPSDDAALAELFNHAHAGLAGTVVRSTQDLSWRVRSQPGMTADGAILAETVAGTLLGYAFVKENGDISELAVAPDGPRHQTAVALISACQDQAVVFGAERIRVNVPIDDIEVSDALRGAEFAANEPEGRHYVASIEPGRLAQILAMGSIRARNPVRLELVQTDPLPWQQGRSTILFTGTSTKQVSLQVRADQRTLNQILLGGQSPWRALASRNMRIRPVHRTVLAVQLLTRIQVSAPWFHALGDIL